MQTFPRQINDWTCFPTVLSWIAGCSIEKIFELAGHDGSEIVEPDLPDPNGRRGFHDVEVMYIAERLNIHLMCFIPKIEVTNCVGGTKTVVWESQTFKRTLERYHGIMVGNPLPLGGNHATLWHKGRALIIDPKGREYSHDYFNVMAFYGVMNKCHILDS